MFNLAGATLHLTTVKGWTAGTTIALGWAMAGIRAATDRPKAKGVEFLVSEGSGQETDCVRSAPGGAVKVCWLNDPDGNNLSLRQLS